MLIVDDDSRKAGKVQRVIEEAIGVKGGSVDLAGSASAAAKLLEGRQYDLLILDLNLPIRDRQPASKDGGLRFLKQIVRGGPRFYKPSHILGLSEYPELVNQYGPQFNEEAWQLVQFDVTSEAWVKTIQNKLIHIAQLASTKRDGAYLLDLAIVTALKPIELDAVLALDAGWREERQPGDDTFYHRGEFARGDARVTVVAAAAIEMGMPAAACITSKLIRAYKPRFVAMAGITAGVGMNFGDIIVADQSWDYGSGKIGTGTRKQSLFAPAPNYIPLDAGLKEKVDFFISRRAPVLAAIQGRWQGNKHTNVLSAKPGPIASGAAVVENEIAINAIKDMNRKVIGIEMETYGVYLAARVAPQPKPLAFAAKSVCDFGKPPKTDEYQRYAAFTSANFIYEFALDQLART